MSAVAGVGGFRGASGGPQDGAALLGSASQGVHQLCGRMAEGKALSNLSPSMTTITRCFGWAAEEAAAAPWAMAMMAASAIEIIRSGCTARAASPNGQ